ncbi:MAG: homoserine dehydrogenase [Chloroflexi bacterium]|nr:homoserine dehydrogenase [Chloroflexota bacterium]
MELKLCFMGLGSVGRELIQLIDRKRDDVRAQYDLSFKIVGIATGRHGILIDPSGIDHTYALNGEWTDRVWPSTEENRLRMIRECGADALVEMSPINRATGRPALDYLELALGLGMHAISANKGPIVHGYRHLSALAKRQGKAFLFESTVMDGFPLLNLYRECLPATRVLSFRGVLNSTTNLILTLMEEGRTFDEAVQHAQSIGIAETDPGNDIDGWDSSVKVCVLSNVLLGADIRPEDVKRTGIRGITIEMIKEAQLARRKWRLVCTAEWVEGQLAAQVAPEEVPANDPLFRLYGTTSAIQLKTDTLNQLTLLETAPTPAQTAFGVLADLISAARGHF